MAPKIAVLAVNPWTSQIEPWSYSYGAWRVLAAVRDLGEARLFESLGSEEAWLAALEDFDPDIVGASLYVWSLPILAPALARWKKPGKIVVGGGPSAHPAMFDRPPFDRFAGAFDALTTADGERIFREVCLRGSVAGVAGLSPQQGGRFSPGPPAAPLRPEEVVSPLQAGLVPFDRTAMLQTFLGCPMGCAFCAWGDSRESPALRRDWLAAELGAIRGLDIPSVLSVDAGINLNRAALRSLLEVDDALGALAGRRFYCQLYPSWYGDEVEALLTRTQADVTIGLQSIDAGYLGKIGRPARMDAFERVLARVMRFADPTVEVILGLPDDHPAGFEATLRYALGLGVRIRAYFCLVLPQALMTRGNYRDRLRWDPVSLELREGPGWSEAALDEAAAALDRLVVERGGYGTRQWPSPSTGPLLRAEGRLGQDNGARLWTIPARRPVGRRDPAAIEGRIDALRDLLRPAGLRLVSLQPEVAGWRIVLDDGGGPRTWALAELPPTLVEPVRRALA